MNIPRTILYVAVTLTVVAVSVHAWATPEHFEEWWGYGVFSCWSPRRKGCTVRP